MCSRHETTDVSDQKEDRSLREKILVSFPLSDLKEEDLIQNPLFSKLLVSLTHHVDQTGLTHQLKTELDQAEKTLQSQMFDWLQFESLHRGLEEMIQEHLVKKQYTDVSPEQSTFFETMEKCLLVSQCIKHLDPSSTTDQDRPPLLGLTPQHVMELLPSEEVVRRMQKSASTQLEKHLKGKCLNLLTYYDPELEDESETLKTMKLSQLSAQLSKDKKRAESLKEICQENRVLLQRQSQVYISELMECIQLLETFIRHHRVKVQTDLDEKKVIYLEQKCVLLHQKLKCELTDILLQTYTSDTIAAHKKIRKELESEMKFCKEEKKSLESKLASFEILGEEFQALAREYCRIQEEIKVKSWAIDEFQRYNEKS
ncbi:unnamed protein product [Ophioblennius macclurei]